MLIRSYILVILFALNNFIAYAQEAQDPRQVIADIVEDLVSQSESEQDYSELVEELLYIAENPINLNSTNYSELKKLFFLSEFQIQSLLDYNDSTGKFLSIYELQLVPGFYLVDVKHLEPFVYAGDMVQHVTTQDFIQGKHEFATRLKTLLEIPKGYSNKSSITNHYLGSKLALYSRYRYRASNFQIGLTAEKDAGEPFFDGTFQSGFDYLSGYAMANDIGRLKKCVIGDYRAEFGQGLTFWNSLTFGKSASLAGLHKRGRGIIPHSSAYESLFLRGVGLTFNFKKIDISVFSSYRKIDANIADTIDDGAIAFTSLPESGYHRTYSEIQNRHTTPEFVVGSNVTLSYRRLKVGSTFFYNRIFAENIMKQPFYSLEPLATERLVCGINADYYYRQHLFYGEIGVNVLTRNVALLAGGELKLSNRLFFSVLGRSYSPSYEARYTAALAEGSSAANENGLLLGLKILAGKDWQLLGYVDLFQFPWMRYGVYAPSVGGDLLLQSENVINPYFRFVFRYRYKQRQGNESISSLQVMPVMNQISQSLRMQLFYQPMNWMNLKSVVELSNYKTDSLLSGEYGFMIAQDININLSKTPLSIRMRFAIFDTESWSSRIYSYENDMLYSFTVPAYYSNGTRFMLMFKYGLTKNADIWLRFAQSYYKNMDVIGSGLDAIEGNTRSEVKCMLRFRF
ncbi:MAG: hypothetical protein PWR03_79 [Tenuifilum sp.]|jgi:hypothetical protein|uniref:ComEA family DNA-binding protein n=1 Tax=Tenuifilum sp. TaxID=2760880 RepID=UPI0024AA1394|nr:helix-hairpin-helix domain-containing protein [Tenuifilum sp.]MDI3525896.1 hypothetical protein [Tenuifilum sp.]